MHGHCPLERHLACSRAAVLLVLLLAAFAAAAQPTPALTRAQVRSTIDAMQELQATFGERPDRSGEIPALEPGHPDYDRALAILRRHGFANEAEWSAVVPRVVSAYVALRMAGQRPELDRKVREALAEIENNPDLTPEQKQRMRQMLAQSMATADAMGSAPPADQAAVRPFVDELDALGGQ